MGGPSEPGPSKPGPSEPGPSKSGPSKPGPSRSDLQNWNCPSEATSGLLRKMGSISIRVPTGITVTATLTLTSVGMVPVGMDKIGTAKIGSAKNWTVIGPPLPKYAYAYGVIAAQSDTA